MKDYDAKAKNAKLSMLKKMIGKLEKDTKQTGVIQILGDAEQVYDCIPTGFLTLDAACTGTGIARGRIVELFGPESSGKSLIAQKIIAACQQHGGVCAYVDMENTFDTTFAAKLGVKVDELAFSQPSCMQDAMKVIDALIDAQVDVIVVDSVAALVPREELDCEVGKQNIALQARYMSQLLRRITGKAAKKGSLVLFINQIRDNVGVLYGCLHADTPIHFVDGRVLPIAEVVNKRIQGQVYSYNEKTKQIEEKAIIDWHDNGLLQENQKWLTIKTSTANGINKITVTNNHIIPTANRGEVKAGDIKVGDMVWTQEQCKFTKERMAMVYGLAISGNARIQFAKNRMAANCTYKLSNHSADYWIRQNLLAVGGNDHHIGTIPYTRALAINIFAKKQAMCGINYIDFPHIGDTECGIMVAAWWEECVKKEEKSIVIASITKTLTENIAKQFVKAVRRLTDCTATQIRYTEEGVKITDEGIKALDSIVAKYKSVGVYPAPVEKNYAYPVKVLSVYTNQKANKNPHKYDLTIEGLHNYLAGTVNGIIVHNSPETTGGGKALKFYASLRLRVSRDKDSVLRERQGGEDVVVGQAIKVKIVKNKTAAPFKEAHFKVYFDGRKIDDTQELADIALSKGLLIRCNAKGEPTETGRQYRWETEPEFLAKNKGEVADEIRKYPKVKEELLKMIQSGNYKVQQSYVDTDDDMTEEELERQIQADAKNIGEAEEIEQVWEDEE